MNYDWDWGVLSDAHVWRILLQGFGVTLALTACAILLGTPCGIAVGAVASWERVPGFDLQSSGHSPGGNWRRTAMRTARLLSLAYIDLVRSLPMLLLILLCYYGLPIILKSIFPIALSERLGSAFSTSVMALAIAISASVADLTRSAATGVSSGSVLAARALGMSRWLTWRHIVLPSVVRDVLPGFTMASLDIWKLSTLCSVVTVYEILHVSDSLIQRNYKPLELYFLVAVFFVLTVIPTTILARHMERTQAFLRRAT